MIKQVQVTPTGKGTVKIYAKGRDASGTPFAIACPDVPLAEVAGKMQILIKLLDDLERNPGSKNTAAAIARWRVTSGDIKTQVEE